MHGEGSQRTRAKNPAITSILGHAGTRSPMHFFDRPLSYAAVALSFGQYEKRLRHENFPGTRNGISPLKGA